MKKLIAFGLALAAYAGACSSAPDQSKSYDSAELTPYACGSIERVHACEGVLLASQPQPADFEALAKDGIRTVINIRKPGEVTQFDEPAVVAKSGLTYVSIPFASPAELTDAVLDQLRAALRDGKQKPILLHCHSANRVGAVWLAHRALDSGLSWEAALAEAKTVGLKAPALETRVKDYVDARAK